MRRNSFVLKQVGIHIKEKTDHSKAILTAILIEQFTLNTVNVLNIE
jgi:hypothetical protein